MENIDYYIRQLVEAVKESPEYAEYKECEAALRRNSELFGRVNEFREHNFELQNNSEGSNLIEIMGQLSRESEELHRIPVVHEYLQSELNICRLLQKISLEINGNLDIHIPIE